MAAMKINPVFAFNDRVTIIGHNMQGIVKRYILDQHDKILYGVEYVTANGSFSQQYFVAGELELVKPEKEIRKNGKQKPRK